MARLLMVLSSFAPLFILWAIRGNDLIPDGYLVAACLALVLLPNIALWARIRVTRKQRDIRELTVGHAEDHRDHLLVYLFAMLLPLYAVNLNSWRALGAALTATAFIVFLLWHLNLHYMNLLFAIAGYRVFTVHPVEDGNPLTGSVRFVLITRRVSLAPADRVRAYRLSNSVYLEMGE